MVAYSGRVENRSRIVIGATGTAQIVPVAGPKARSESFVLTQTGSHFDLVELTLRVQLVMMMMMMIISVSSSSSTSLFCCCSGSGGKSWLW